MNHISTTQSWSRRELDWFNAERRFIFGCRSSDELDYWM